METSQNLEVETSQLALPNPSSQLGDTATQKVEEVPEHVSQEIIEKTSPQLQDEDASWTKERGSPGKQSRLQEESSISLISPTRFDILGQKEGEDAEDQNEEDSEEGEIVPEQEERVESRKHESSLRAPLPRLTKGSNKFLTESFALNTKASKPSVSSKKKSTRK